jgi:hypothetical protein
MLQLAVMTCCTNPVHSNKHNSLQRAATEQIGAQHAAGCLCLFLCYFGLAYSLQLAVLTCCTNPVHPAARLTCKQLQLTSLPCTALHNMVMHVCPFVRVLTQSDMPCSLYLAVGMLHKPSAALHNSQQIAAIAVYGQNKLPSM